MRLCQYRTGGAGPRLGVRTPSGNVVPVAALMTAAPATMVGLAQAVADSTFDLDVLAREAAALHADDERRLGARTLDLADFAPPVTRPPKFFAIAINGRANWERSIKPPDPKAQYFIKLHTCITGPADPIEIPDIGSVGPEVELALVIGRGGRHIRAAEAVSHILGYTVHNDVTAHDLRAKSEWIRLRRKDGTEEQLTYPGRWKNFDTFSPMGPWLVTADEVPDPHALKLTAWLNGELVQEGSTAECVYRVPELIAYLSAAHTLEPGDIISIGTVPAVPPWTMAGIHLRHHGGVIECEIEGLGRLANPIKAV